MDETARSRTTEIDPLQDINLRLSRCLKEAFRQNVIETAALAATAVVAFWLLGASDENIGAKLLLVTLTLSILSGHCYQMMRHHRCESLILKQLEMSAKDRAKTSRLYDLSILDPLTGLHNRRFGEQCLKQAVEQSKKNGDNLAVVLIDLDYFKEINDQFGHAAGDLALKEFSRSLRKAIRACDTPVRLGGDEFLLVLPECPRDKVGVIMERIGTPAIHFDGMKIHVCSSSGVAQYEYGDTSETLLARADEVLYAKKAARRGGSPRLPSPLVKPALRGGEPPVRAGGTTEPVWQRRP